jgi:hypothetical protein
VTGDDEGRPQTTRGLRERLRETFGRARLNRGLAAFEKGDFAKALALWQPLAAAGHADAQFNLGLMHQNANGVVENLPQALSWYLKAAEQGLAAAQNRVGVLYARGEFGVPQDREQALRWFLTAAQQSYAHAQLNLGIACSYGYGTPRDPELALKSLGDAAERGLLADARADEGFHPRNIALGEAIVGDCVAAYAFVRRSPTAGATAESVAAGIRSMEPSWGISDAEIYAGEVLARAMAMPENRRTAIAAYIEHPVLPLPELAVRRETYCSQQTTDQVVRFIYAHNTDLLRTLRAEENNERYKYMDDNSHQPFGIEKYAGLGVLEYLADIVSRHIEVPATLMGKFDLICELSRRLRQAHALAEEMPLGRPLAASLDGPFPPLAEAKIGGATVHWGHAAAEDVERKQDFIDRALRIAYARRPDLWLQIAEMHRMRDLDIGQWTQFHSYLEELTAAEFPDHATPYVGWDLYREAWRRLTRMCGIPGPA